MKGKWIKSSTSSTIPDPLNGESFIKVSEVNAKEIQVGSISSSCFLKLLLYLKFNMCGICVVKLASDPKKISLCRSISLENVLKVDNYCSPLWRAWQSALNMVYTTHSKHQKGYFFYLSLGVLILLFCLFVSFQLYHFDLSQISLV